MPVNRALTDQEKGWLISGLNSLRTEDQGCWLDSETGEELSPIDIQALLDQIDRLRVTYECDCGQSNCRTIAFQHYRPGKTRVIVDSATDDGRMLLIDADGETRLLTGLEII
jgi:hypothetical protein